MPTLMTIRLFKSFGARDPDRRWSNTYEVNAVGADPSTLIAFTNALAAAEKLVHFDKVHFLSATISTWLEDSQPYDPTKLTTVELGGTGAIASGGFQIMDSNVCWVCKYVPGLGRTGRRFYRGVLGEDDVESGGDGKFTFSPTSTIRPTGTREVAFKAALAPLINPAAADGYIVMITEPGVGGAAIIRGINSVASGGVAINRRNHRYFDRAAG